MSETAKTITPPRFTLNGFMLAFIFALKEIWKERFSQGDTDASWDEVLEDVFKNYTERLVRESNVDAKLFAPAMPSKSALMIANEMFPTNVDVKVYILMKERVQHGASYTENSVVRTDTLSVPEPEKTNWEFIREEVMEKWAGARSMNTGNVLEIIDVFPANYTKIEL